jgi:hypothetical protein
MTPLGSVRTVHMQECHQFHSKYGDQHAPPVGSHSDSNFQISVSAPGFLGKVSSIAKNMP